MKYDHNRSARSNKGKKSVFAERDDDVTVRSTFDLLDITCHHSILLDI